MINSYPSAALAAGDQLSMQANQPRHSLIYAAITENYHAQL